MHWRPPGEDVVEGEFVAADSVEAMQKLVEIVKSFGRQLEMLDQREARLRQPGIATLPGWEAPGAKALFVDDRWIGWMKFDPLEGDSGPA